MEQNYITHHGVLGMKWGVRRSKAQLARAGRKKDVPDDAHEDYKRAHSSKKLSDMSDKELRETNNRLQMERQYRDLTKKTSKGKKLVNAFIASGVTITGVMTAVTAYQKLGNTKAVQSAKNMALDKIGDAIVKDIKIGRLTN